MSWQITVSIADSLKLNFTTSVNAYAGFPQSLGARSQSLVRVCFVLSAHLIRFALLRTVCQMENPHGASGRFPPLWSHACEFRVCGHRSAARSGTTSSWVCSALSPALTRSCFHRCSTGAAAAFNTLITGYHAL